MIKPNGVIAYLTDVGCRDPYVGSIKGITLSICLQAKIIDITHEIPSFDIYEASFTLLLTYSYFPPGTVFVVVVPGVGVSEKPILIVTKNYFFIGPNNGVLAAAADDDSIEQVIALDSIAYFKKKALETFHGRDIFAPAAAWLVCGVSLNSLGSPMDPAEVTKLDMRLGHQNSENSVGCTELRVQHADKYGNIILSEYFRNLAEELHIKLSDDVRVFAGGTAAKASVAKSFSDIPKNTLILYKNSFGFAELAINQGSAQNLLKIGKKDLVRICRQGFK